MHNEQQQQQQQSNKALGNVPIIKEPDKSTGACSSSCINGEPIATMSLLMASIYSSGLIVLT